MYGKDEKEKKEKPDRSKDVPPAELLASMKKDIDSFAGSAPQFDDITMMIFDYKGSK
jgi:serine phosphatase RsbU (regulator of sigma subunit)